ncbi:SIR2 family protein [Lactococcus insecticola]|uniref:Uncharacterized protein n=1 Tax=Pseudolactococcus insecticola TaxID=2709158 RepID=A0A6A0B5S8_9LACT|nr:SIR2 family protein [Lactococcus insecticola]GFH40043.1 hypothetical protein Hs20B_04410 [Lactococcus insecticola]
MSDGLVYMNNQNKYSKSNGGFKKNDVAIKKDDKAIDESEFTSLVRSEVSNFIHHSFDNIVVLVGAGASVTDNNFDKDENGFAKAGVTVSKIADEVYEQLKSKKYQLKDSEVEVFDLESLSKLSMYQIIENKNNENDQFITDEIINGESLKPEFNLEDFLSNLFAYEKFVASNERDKFINTKNAILDIIKKATSYDYDAKLFNHVAFLNVVSKLSKSGNKLNIVTTNYDTLIENAAESMKATVFDGFSFSQSPQFDSTMFDWNLVKEVPNLKTHELVYKPKVFNLLKIHGSLTWEHSKTGKNIVRKPKQNVENPIMVFPSSDKYAQSYQEPYFDLFAKFQELLKVPNTLFITSGFSFADNHISKMILSAIKTNDGLATLVTDFNIEPENPNDNWQDLVSIMKERYQIAFLQSTMNSDLDEYLREKPNEN